MPYRAALPTGLLALLASCASAGPRPPALAPVAATPALPPRALRGTVRYEARHPTQRGASRDVELRPARFVAIDAIDARDAVLAHCAADAQGAFACAVPGAAVALTVLAHAVVDGHDASCSDDPDGRRLQSMRFALPQGDAPLDVVARDGDRGGPGGAFHIVDTVLRGLEATRAWTGRTLPPLVVYWGRGVTTEWSYYRGERPEHSGRYVLELLGGQPGRQSSTDTDEHDEGIILHEVGHFVMDRLSTNSSTGGTHPSHTLVDAGLAWEEGRATWFSSAVRREGRYQDTIGLEPGGSLRVDHDLERSGGPRGIGAENSTSDVLWDLTDGAEGYADADRDGVALGPEVVLRAMVDMNRVPGAYPCLSSFLDFITTQQTLEGAARAPLLAPEALRAMLAATGEAQTVLARTIDQRWPEDLTAPARVSGKIDGLTEPAPSGGPHRPGNGFDAVHVYRVQLTARAWINLELRIEGSGRPNDHTDLDLELRDIRGEVITRAAGTSERETLSRLLQPGWYIVYVRDGGNGNRANYELSVRTRPV